MTPTITTIAEHKTHQDYSVDFFGNDLTVTQTKTPSVIKRWINDVIYRHRRSRSPHPLVVGVGVNWAPHWHSSTPASHYRPADTLQLCVGEECLIVQLLYCNRVPIVLRRFLTNPKTTFVGVWNGQDKKRLERTRHRLESGKLLDIRKYVGDRKGGSMGGSSFEKIVDECLGFVGVSLEREISKSDWSVEYLSYEQLLQASVDAYVCFNLGVSNRLWEV